MALDYFLIEDVGVFGSSSSQGFNQQRTQRSTEPVVRRDIEPNLRSLQYRLRKLVLHQMLQHDLLA
jgi:hypothetical protein